LLGLGILIILLLQVPSVQNRIAQKVISRLNDNLSATISIDRISLAFFSKLRVNGIVLASPTNDTLIMADKLNVSIRLLPLAKNRLHIKRINIDAPKVFLEKNTSDSTLNIVKMFRSEKKRTQDENRTPPDISVSRMVISDADFEIADRVNNSNIQLSLNTLRIQPELLDFPGKQIIADRFRIDDLDLEIRGPEKDSAVVASDKQNSIANPLKTLSWKFGINAFTIRDSRLMISEIKQRGGNAATLLLLENLSAEIDSLRAGGSLYKASVLTSSFGYNNKLNVNELGFIAEVNDRTSTVKDFVLRTGESMFALDAFVRYTSMQQLISEPTHASLNIKLRSETDPYEMSRLTKKELRAISYPPLTMNGDLHGSLSDLVIDSIVSTFGEAAHLSLSGDIRGFPELDSLSGTLNLKQFTVLTKVIRDYLPDSILPRNITLPDTIKIIGQMSGHHRDLASNLNINSSAGEVVTTVQGSWDTLSAEEVFDIRLTGKDIDAGYLLEKQDTIGNVSMTAEATVRATEFNNPSVRAQLEFQELEVMKYNYRDLTISGNYSKKSSEAQMIMSDENVDIDLTGYYRNKDSIPRLGLDGKVSNLQLGQLNLVPGSSGLSFDITADLTGTDPADMKTNATIRGIDYHTGETSFRLDTLRLRIATLRDPLKYELQLRNFYVEDSLYLYSASVNSSMDNRQMDLAYRASLENLPGTRPGVVTLDGTGRLILEKDSMVIKSNTLLYNHQFMDTAIYDLTASRIVRSPGEEYFETHLTGSAFNLDASGNLLQKNGSGIINGKADVDSLDLILLRPFLVSSLSALEGKISGNASFSGPVSNPDIEGSVTFRNTRFNPKALNTSFLLKDETLGISNREVRLNDLALTDNQGNNAVLSGKIDLDKNATENFDLDLHAETFHLVNKPASRADLYYGSVYADIDGVITGSFQNPVIDLNTGFNKDSRFAFILPGSKTQSGEGIIEFVNTGISDSVRSDSVALAGELKARAGMNLELAASAAFTDRLTLKLVTDPVSGEYLELNGNGNLSFLLDRSGNMSLTGRYEISEGVYELQLFELIRREFSIEKGSSLAWSGDLIKAEADLSAVYNVETSVSELMQYGSNNDQPAVYGKVPLEVVMHLTGPLLTPEISFEIRESNQSRSAGLAAALERLSANESELNKQVLSLLVFNRFISESAASSDPLSYEISNRSRQSISSLLSSQLDRFADQYIKGVELDINVDSYETGMGTDISARTDLSADVSTDIFNDRLTLEVGGSVAVEETGAGNKSFQAGDLAGDFKAEYKLSRDGVYRLNIFNRTDYENEIDGEVTKTGVSLIFNKNFTSFRELFGTEKKKKGGEDGEN